MINVFQGAKFVYNIKNVYMMYINIIKKGELDNINHKMTNN